MKIKTNILEHAINWVIKGWEESGWYNLSMNKVGESKAPKWFTDFVVNSFAPLARDVATLKQDMVEVKQRLTNVEKDVAVLKRDMIEVKKDIAVLKQDIIEIKSLPTIQRELKLK